MNQQIESDEKSIWLAILAIIFWPLGLFLYLWWMNTKPNRAHSVKVGLIFALMIGAISFCNAYMR